jgi:uncharacterized pyridoxal phosphate-containing UPF0001 family protein
MAVAPFDIDEKDLRKLFDGVNSAFVRLKSEFGDTIKHLSMGMSGDFETAIASGANLIRPGRVLFGDRDYT